MYGPLTTLSLGIFLTTILSSASTACCPIDSNGMATVAVNRLAGSLMRRYDSSPPSTLTMNTSPFL